MTANSQQPLTTIVPLDPIWVRFNITESHYLTFKQSGTLFESPLTLVLADGSEFPNKGHIQNTLNQVDPKTGTLEMQASFPNPAARAAARTVRQGSRADRTAKNVDPGSAAGQSSNCRTCKTCSPWAPATKSNCTSITTADRVGDSWVVTKGLKSGDRVIVEGQLKVRPGMTVHPQPYRGSGGAGGGAGQPTGS